MTSQITVAALADRQDALPLFTELLHYEWGRFRGRTPDQTERRLRGSLRSDAMPMALMASCGDEPGGVVFLRKRDLGERQDLGPWLSSLFVIPSLRGRGVGKALARAVEDKARELAYDDLYLFTPNLESYFHRLGWRSLGRGLELGRTVTIMTKGLDSRRSTCIPASPPCSASLP